MTGPDPRRFAAPIALAFATLLFCPARLTAQDASTAPTTSDTMRQIQEIAREVTEQLEDVDRMLLESSASQSGRTTSKDKLARSMDGSKAAVDGIDRLIEKLHELKDQCGN